MKLVTFNRAMAPYGAGETKLVPDDVATRLLAEGAINRDPPDFPAQTEGGVAVVAKPSQPKLTLPGRRPQSYQTK